MGSRALKEINEENCKAPKEAKSKKKDDDNKPEPPSGDNKETAEESTQDRKDFSFKIYLVNQGKLIPDATCTPADMHYPTDLSQLNEAREKLDNIIDIFTQDSRQTRQNAEVLSLDSS